MLKNLWICATILCTVSTYAQQKDSLINSLDEVILIDSRFNMKRENSGKVVTKITSQELEHSIGQTLPEVLNRVSGIEINGAHSNDGQNLGYYIRGGRNRQVVIMVDGVQIIDPSSISNDFDLRLLPLDQVESIEIIKGAASTLYGSGAATAVISITTKGPADKKIALQAYSILGTNQTQQNQDYDIAKFDDAVGISGKLSKFNYQLNFSNRYSENISAIKSNDENTLFQDDPFSKYNVYARLGYEINKQLKFYFYGNFDHFNSSYDDSFMFTDANNELKSDQFRTGSHWSGTYKNGSFSFDDSYTEIDRKVRSDYPNKYDSKQYSFDANNKYTFSDKIYTVLGLNGNFGSFNSYSKSPENGEYTQSVSDTLANFDIIDPYLNVVYISASGFHLNTGARLDIHSEYGTHWVYNINPSYSYELQKGYIKALASYSTAYITPSLYQLFAGSYGNENLSPEESATFEAGLEYNTGKIRLSTVYFRRKTKNYIDFVTVDPVNFVSQYRNISAEFSADGVEVEFEWQLSEKLNLKSNYTFTQPDKRFALRIPKHKLNAQLRFQVDDKTFTSLSYQLNGKRTDSYYSNESFENVNVSLGSYSLLDFYINKNLTKNFTVFAGVSNILNEDYQELYRFNTLGRNVRIGASLSL